MPKPGTVGKVKKLKDGDDGFDPDVDSFEVEMMSVTPPKRRMTLVGITARLEKVQANKARAIAAWDERIERLTAIQEKLEAAS